MKKRALLSGTTGQDGSYLAELLLGKGYVVYGIERRCSTTPSNRWRIEHLLDDKNFHLISGDVTSGLSISNAVQESEPHEIYNLAAQSFVAASWNEQESTFAINQGGFLNILRAAKEHAPKAKIYQASTSEMYGNAPAPQSETTVFSPESPYAVAKLAAHHLARIWRESYDMFVSCGILFNHESPRRGIEFVTRKIAHHVAKIKLGIADEIRLGNLEAKRDWGYAGDYVEAMWRMLQQDKPGDFVIATGETHTVRDFVEAAFEAAGMDPKESVKKYVIRDPKFYRPIDVNMLLGDPTKAKVELGWTPEVSFRGLVRAMVNSELNSLRDGSPPKD